MCIRDRFNTIKFECFCTFRFRAFGPVFSELFLKHMCFIMKQCLHIRKNFTNPKGNTKMYILQLFLKGFNVDFVFYARSAKKPLLKCLSFYATVGSKIVEESTGTRPCTLPQYY